jgi:hypothetical protein
MNLCPMQRKVHQVVPHFKKPLLGALLLGLASCGESQHDSSVQSFPSKVESLSLASATWEENETIPATGRPNPLALEGDHFKSAQTQGKRFALDYPIEITGMTIPHETLKRFFEPSPWNPLKWIFEKLAKGAVGFGTIDQMNEWLGLHHYPADSDTGVYQVPRPPWQAKYRYRMGTSLVQTPMGAEGLTYSCAACHSGQLFGKSVLGLTNRFPRANEFFLKGKELTASLDINLVAPLAGMSKQDKEILLRLKQNVPYIEGRKPLNRGLDTSLAHVALSLSHRAEDAWATKDPEIAAHPRPNPLQGQPGDSKPAVWWNLKYKNKWLSDGSVVSGNPIYTNILWNEIGRGTDLHELDDWMDQNTPKLDALTTAVFASEAPLFFDFFDPQKFDIEGAKRGQKTFQRSCAGCHGTYQKGWDNDPTHPNLRFQMATTQVIYHSNTPVVDVGTDPWRYRGMTAFADGLNGLALSQKLGVRIVPQAGYVPPPLVGIWARWPYFHNNSVPTLCDLLTVSEQRPVTFYAGEAISPKDDFDATCNGYPQGQKTPKSWKQNAEAMVDTRVQGVSNRGHDQGIFIFDGRESLTSTQKQDLIKFLQTL